jgi:hypothetical protein
MARSGRSEHKPARKSELMSSAAPMPTSEAEDAAPPSSFDDREFLTSAELPGFFARKGIPYSRSTHNKLSMQRAGPPPAGLWGNRFLYRPAEALEWARRRLREIAA